MVRMHLAKPTEAVGCCPHVKGIINSTAEAWQEQVSRVSLTTLLNLMVILSPIRERVALSNGTGQEALLQCCEKRTRDWMQWLDPVDPDNVMDG